MRPMPRLAALLLCLPLAAYASTPSAPVASYVLVRHAEKASDDPRDPNLSEAGRARAEKLAQWFQDKPLRAVYATAYKRTQQTAEPTARAHHLSVVTYDAKRPAAEFAAQLRSDWPSGTVLVVGHSNTVPEIASALCRCSVGAMPETEFNRRTRVDFYSEGHIVVTQTRDR